MKKKVVFLSLIFQLTATLLLLCVFRGVIKITKIMQNKEQLYFYIIILILSVVFYFLSYLLAKKYPEESAKATKIIYHPNKKFIKFAFLLIFLAIAFLLTYIPAVSSFDILLKILIIIIGVLGGCLIFRNKAITHAENFSNSPRHGFICSVCGAEYNPSDYCDDASEWFCSQCKNTLPKK
jgi:hypothetical protein